MCDDVNECDLNHGSCDINSDCYNTIVSFILTYNINNCVEYGNDRGKYFVFISSSFLLVRIYIYIVIQLMMFYL